MCWTVVWGPYPTIRRVAGAKSGRELRQVGERERKKGKVENGKWVDHWNVENGKGKGKRRKGGGGNEKEIGR